MNRQSAHTTLFGSRGPAMAHDVFDRQPSISNGAVVGLPASGESTPLNDQAVRVFAVGSKVRIVDVGQSYAGFCHLLSGWHFATKTSTSVTSGRKRQNFMPGVVATAIQGSLRRPPGKATVTVCKAGALKSSSAGLHLVRKHVTYLKGLTP